MDIGVPLIDYGAVDIGTLRETMLHLPADFWLADREARTTVAGDRPGDAVYFYNPRPPKVKRMALREARSGFVSVLRHRTRPLFDDIQALIDRHIRAHFPECDVMRVQLAELPPGQVIEPHQDINILALIHRLHVPIVTHPDVEFIIDGNTFFLKVDTLYDLNNVMRHSVTNRSDVMRVHLLVDMMPHSLARAKYFDDEDEMVRALGGRQLIEPID